MLTPGPSLFCSRITWTIQSTGWGWDSCLLWAFLGNQDGAFTACVWIEGPLLAALVFGTSGFAFYFDLGVGLYCLRKAHFFLLLFLRTKTSSFFSTVIAIYLSHLQFKNSSRKWYYSFEMSRTRSLHVVFYKYWTSLSGKVMEHWLNSEDLIMISGIRGSTYNMSNYPFSTI